MSARVLLVDDDPQMLDLCAQTLAEEGFEILRAGDGAEAVLQLHAAGRAGRRVDVIVSDVKMPRLTGIELLERLEGQVGGPRVVVISAFVDQETVEEAERLGASAVIAKPFGLTTLIDAVRLAAAG